MKLTDGEDDVKTWMGSFCSLLLTVVMFAYTVQKIEVMISKKDIDILTALYDSYLDSDFDFGAKQGFNIAIKWQSLADEKETLDPSIGKLSFKYSEWGYQEDGKYFEEEGEIENHICTHEELGLTGNQNQ